MIGKIFKFFRAGNLTEPPGATSTIGRRSQERISDAETCKSQGNEFLAGGNLKQAEACYRQSISVDPRYAEAYNNLGIVLKQQRRFAEARDCLEQAIRIAPGLANAHYNLGKVLEDQGDLNAAQACLRQAQAIDPNLAEKYCLAGNTCHAQGRLDEAVENYRQTLALKPDHAGAHNNLGVALHAQGKLDEAATSYRQAILHKPDFAEAYRNLGVVLHPQGKLEEAVASYDQALQYRPDYADAQMNRGLALLTLGRFPQGWLDCEKRWERQGKEPLPETPYPCWLGEEVGAGMRLLIQSEQGLGDTMQMARYIPLLEARGIKCWLSSPDPLRGLLSRSFPEACVADDPCPAGLDFRIPIMSLPLAMRTFSEMSIPNSTPYLLPDQARMAYWREQLSSPDRKRVGLVWRGSPIHANDRNRSLSLADILPLVAAQPTLQFVTLQKGLTIAERTALGDYGNVRMLDVELADFDETAAVMSNLDLVISVDSSPAHLSGALGRTTWILLPFSPDWRWLVDRHDSPWYPTARLFRQTAPANWSEPLAAISAALSRLG